ncbi:ATP-dependent DNA helicase PIF1-like [Frankliniella occidentalis]|uniref:ATP-dependent DNA helicase n=1 Tax=Frankliniella occidentalis TaxID=133901 RepID=A0A6J1TE18_FRAOC|nr:ATP-dependent DNA helicase PIF1-like [Frankliniella occidentalis]
MFLDAPGGYGKSTLLQVVAADARSKGDIVLCVASSGIAALNLDGGTTAHSMFKLPLDLGDGTGYWNLRNTQQRADLIREAKLIIFDEISMAHKFLIEILDRSLQDLMGTNEVLGGKVCLFAGDFRQIPPVVPSAKTPSDVVFASLKCSHLWPHFRQFRLTVPQRTRSDDEYSSFLLSVGNDTLPQHVFGEGDNTDKVIALHGIRSVEKLDELIASVYPPDILRDPDASSTRAILCAHNVNVREINSAVMAKLPGGVQQLVSVDTIDKEMEGVDIDIDTLHLAEGKGVPNHILDLKIGAVCMIMRNLNMSERLVNGTKVIVEGISPRLVTVRKPGTQELIAIPRILFRFPVLEGSPLQMCRRQFPLQVCYGMTVHKSQGQTIFKVGLDLRSDCFTHGQLYVALSRTRRSDDVTVLGAPDRCVDNITYVRNIVYQELLDNT